MRKNLGDKANTVQMNIGTWTAVFDEDRNLWMSDFRHSGLYKYDLSLGELQFVYRFKSVLLTDSQLHESMYHYKNKLYMCAHMDSTLLRVYDIANNREEIISLLPEKCVDHYAYSFHDDVISFFLKKDGCTVIEYHIDSDTVVNNINATEIITKVVNDNYDDFTLFPFEKGVIIWLQNRKRIIRLDYEYNVIEEVILDSLEEDVSGIFYDNREYWILLMSHHYIYSYNSTIKALEKYEYESDEVIDIFEKQGGKAPYKTFGSIISFNNKIVVTNYYGKHGIKVSSESKKLEKLYSEDKDYMINTNFLCGGSYQCVVENNDHLYVCPCMADRILEFDENLAFVRSYAMNVQTDDQTILEMMDEYIKRGLLCEGETELLSLETFINCIAAGGR